MSHIYYWEKLAFLKLIGEVNFLERKVEEMHQFWRAKRYKVYLGKRLFGHYCLELSLIYKIVPQISFNLFAQDTKGFYQSSLGNKVDFMDIMNVYPNILAKI